MSGNNFDNFNMRVVPGRKRSYIIRCSPTFKEQVDEVKRYMYTEKHLKISDYDATELLGRNYKHYKRNEKIWGF